MSIAWKQKLKPQGRNYDQVAQMLIDNIAQRPQLLMCKRCKGEHVCTDPTLTIHCACGAVTRFKRYALFHGWSSITWLVLLRRGRGICDGDTNAFRDSPLSSADLVDEPCISPQLPLDTRVQLWRLRRA